MRTILFKSFVGYLVVSLVVYLSPVPFAYANPVLQNPAPSGGSNVASAGSATIRSSSNVETINQKSQNAVIDWSSFNIGGKETTKFIDPNSSSLTVNRVHDNDPSKIFGTLSSNGNIVLINPNGVFFGKGSVVDVNGIVATTSNVSNAAVMGGGRMHFTPGGTPNATVENQGTITAQNAGLVGLVAPNVKNSGVITANLGKVQMASGDTFTLDFYGDKLMEVAITDPNVSNQLVQNSGTIESDGGTVKLTAAAGRKIVNSLIDFSGEIKAPAFKEHDGTIVIYAEGSNAVKGNVAANKGTEAGSSTVLVNGTLDASGKKAGERGGNIVILGDDIAILSGSYLDASGVLSGGNIKIGGDFHGGGTTPTAAATVVQNNTTINANATDSGNGGNVAVWSDNYTNFLGLITARGGPNGGNGGFVETSGKHTLNMQGLVDASAAKGVAGTWLMDPEDVNITSSDSDIGGNPSFVPGGTQATASLNVNDITTALNAGTNVTVTTGGDAQTGPNGGSITVSSAVSATTGTGGITGNLTLSSYKDININSAITLGGGGVTGGALTLDADNAGNGIGAIAVTANITTNGGNVTMGGGNGAISAGNGYAVGDATYHQGILLNGATINSGAGTIVMNGTGYSNNATGDLKGIWLKGGSVVQSTTGAITAYGRGGTGNTAGTWYYNSGIDIYGAGSKISSAQGAINLNGTGGGGNASYAAGVDTAQGGKVVSTGTGGGAATIAITGVGGANSQYGFGVALETDINTVTGNVTITGTGTASGSSSALNNGIVVSAPIAVTGGANVTFNATAGNGGNDIRFYHNNTRGGASDTGNITINADTLNYSAGTFQTTGNVIFGPRTASTTIGVAGGAGTLNISSGVLSSVTAGSLTVGNTADSGAMTVNARTWTTPLSLVSGSGVITIAGAQAMGANNFTLQTDATPTFSSTVTTTGNVLLEPASVGTTVGIAGGAGTLNIGTGILGDITAGSITIGSTSDTGLMTVNAYTWSNSLSLVSGSGPITIAGAQAMGTNNFTLQTDATPTFSSTVTTTGNVLLEPASVGTTVGIAGGAGTLNIGTGILGDITAGSITIGSTSDTGLMTVGANTWSFPVTLNNGSGTIEFSGAQTLGANSLTAVSNSGNIQLDQNAKIASTASSGNSIVLAAGGNVVNNDSNDGAGALSPGTGTARWIAYSTGNGDTKNGLAESQDVYGKTYTTEAPGSVPGSTNTWVYSDGLLTVTASNQTIIYGSSPNTTATAGSTYSYSCNPTCGSNPITGGPTISVSGVTTSGTSGKDNAGTWNNAISVSAATAAGYIIAYVTGNLIVNPMAITVTAATNTKAYDGTTTATATPTVTAGSLVTGDTATWTEVYTSATAGTGKTLTASAGTVTDGNGGNNYAVTFVDNNTGVINAIPVSGGGGIPLSPTPPVSQPSAPVPPVVSHPAPPASPVLAATSVPSTVVGVSENPSVIQNSNMVNIQGETPSSMNPGGYMQIMQVQTQAASDVVPTAFNIFDIQSLGSLFPRAGNPAPVFIMPDSTLDEPIPQPCGKAPCQPVSSRTIENENVVMYYDPANDNDSFSGLNNTDHVTPVKWSKRAAATTQQPNKYQVANNGQAIALIPEQDNPVPMIYNQVNGNSDSTLLAANQNKPVANAEDKKKASRAQNTRDKIRDRLLRFGRAWRSMRSGQLSQRLDAQPDNG